MKVYLIAGEASGDVLGALLMKSIRAERPDAEFYGIGGALMAKEGMQSLFPMTELSIMGLAEILPRIKHILGRIRETIADIHRVKPDIVVTIDAPDFCFRVVKGLRADKPSSNPVLVHYVAPTVWAWRAGRAKKLAGLYDGVLCLFPFEPPYFIKHRLSSGYVGHPVMEQGFVDASGATMRTELGIGDDCRVLGLMFGSRNGEIERHGAILREIAEKLQKENSQLHLLVPTLPHVEEKVRALLAGLRNVHIIHNPDRKTEVFAAMDAAVAVSGTVALELAVANVPHVIAYRMNRMTWAIIRKVIRIRYAHLANILLNKEAVPEFIQDDCDPDLIVPVMKGLLKDAHDVEQQRAEFATVRKLLHGKTKDAPSLQAARFVIDLYDIRNKTGFVPYSRSSTGT